MKFFGRSKRRCIFAGAKAISESSSVGRARPCQGRGRGFESRLSLETPRLRGFFIHTLARVVELVDTKDLKSFGHCGRAGSSPASGTAY